MADGQLVLSSEELEMGYVAARPGIEAAAGHKVSTRPTSEPLDQCDARDVPVEKRVRGRALRNAMGTVTLGWMFGAVWNAITSGGSLTGSAPLTLFARTLGASPLQFGLLAAMPFIASLLSLPASLLIERTGKRKGIFLGGLYFQRFLWFPMVLVPMWIVTHLGMAWGSTAVGALLAIAFCMHAGNALGNPAWVSWMADLVPSRVRGKYFSQRRQWGIATAAPAALLVGWLIDHYASPGGSMGVLTWCTIIFMASAVFGVADIALFQLVPNIKMQRPSKRVTLRDLVVPLRNKRFLWFSGLVGVLTFAVSSMGSFCTLYLIDKVGIKGTDTQIMLLVVPMLAQFMVLPIWGSAIDTMGKKPVLAVATVGLIPTGIGWIFIDHANAWWLGSALAALGTALWTGIDLANFQFVLEMTGRRGKAGGSTFAAANNVIINLCGCVGGLSAGVMFQVLRDWHWRPAYLGKEWSCYELLFLSAVVIRAAAAAVFLPRIREPRAKSATQVLRYVVNQLLNQLLRWMELARHSLSGAKQAALNARCIGHPSRGKA